MKTFRKNCWQWIALFCIGFCESVYGQSRARRVEEPRWMTLNISESSVGAFAEATYDETTFENGRTITHNHLFVGPSVGVNLDGSIYHPNLFRFRVNTEGSYGWSQDNVESPTGSTHRSMFEYLGRFNGTADIFANKPLNGQIFGGLDHTYRDYDFFNRVTVDSIRYGAQLNYSKDRFSGSAGYSHQEEDATGIAGGLTHSESDVMRLAGRDDRAKGASTFSYTYSQYNRGDFGVTGTGSDHTVAISDSEKFGAREQYRLNSGASYSRRDSFDEPNDDINANVDFAADHKPNLTSLYDLNYNHFGSGTFSSDNYAGRTQLRHQLYESLTSTLIAQASDTEFSDSINSGYVRRFGGGFSENYTKHLGEDHRLNINNSVLVEHTEQDSITTIENERHVFFGNVGGSGFSSFFLTLPQAIESTIVVTDQNDLAPAFVRGIDYDVRILGSRTIIERMPGSRIADGSTVLVDYETERLGAGSYESLSEVFQIRFDLFKNLWGIYARMNLYTHNAPEELRVQNLTAFAFGTDLTWRWLRTGAEYEIYRSDQSDYTALRLFQSLSFRPDDASTIGFEFSESWADYTDANRQEENYRFIMLYHRNLAARFRFDFDAGIHLRRGQDVDQTLATVRPGIEYVIGKTTIKAGYDFQHQVYLEREERNRHLLFLRIRRVF